MNKPEANAATEPIAPAKSTDPDDPDPKATFAKSTRQRLLILLALVSVTFFFDGCESGKPEYTVGVVPFAQVSFGDLGWGQPCKLLNFWPVGLTLNILVIVTVLLALMFRSDPRIQTVRNFVTQRIVWISTILTVGIFNSFLLIPVIWMWGVFTPMGWLMQPFGDKPSVLITRLAGRFLFVLWVLVLFGVLTGIGRLYSRYVLVDQQRWWQMRLGGMFAIMVILGTLIGIVGRIVMQNAN